MSRTAIADRHRVENLVEDLQSSMEVNFDPAWRLLDRLPVVVRPPALHKGEPEDAKPPEVVHPDPSRSSKTYCRSDPPSTALSSTHSTADHSRCLGCRSRLSGGSLLVHLPVALAEIKHLGVSQRVDLVHSVSWGPAGLAVQVVRLHEDRVVAPATDPDVALADQVQFDAFPNVQTSLLACLRPVHVAKSSQTKPIASAWVDVAVHHSVLPGGGHLERLAHLGVQLEIANAAPELWHLQVGDWSWCWFCCPCLSFIGRRSWIVVERSCRLPWMGDC